MRRALILPLLFLFACEKKDPVVATVNEVGQAAEDRDAAAVMKHLAATYSGPSGGRAEIEQALKRYFFAYRSIDVSIQQLETSHSSASGAATFRVDFSGIPKEIGGLDQLMPRSAVYRFDVDLIVENGEWKISSAEWREEPRSGL